MIAALLSLALVAAPVPVEQPKPNPLTPKEIADGWILLFDGETTFGWDAKAGESGKKPELRVKEGNLHIAGSGGGTVWSTTTLREVEIQLEYRSLGAEADQTSMIGIQKTGMYLYDKISPSEWKKWKATWSRRGCRFTNDGKVGTNFPQELSESPCTLLVTLPMNDTGKLELRNVKLRPLNSQSLFNGKNLDGWKVTQSDPKRTATKFEVTKDGELSAKNGPGDLQTEKQFDDFVLQLECKTLGKALNSGVFFRCIPDQYQNGYEAQIQNAWIGDRTKPIDFGTGAIYRRIAARKVVADDNEWFTLTLAAQGPHFSTWVNGYQTVDWTDDRKANDNPRQGLRLAKGHLSIQGHDPTTDLLFRNIRIVELKKE